MTRYQSGTNKEDMFSVMCFGNALLDFTLCCRLRAAEMPSADIMTSDTLG
jgi:hypothetical protein